MHANLNFNYIYTSLIDNKYVNNLKHTHCETIKKNAIENRSKRENRYPNQTYTRPSLSRLDTETEIRSDEVKIVSKISHCKIVRSSVILVITHIMFLLYGNE